MWTRAWTPLQATPCLVSVSQRLKCQCLDRLSHLHLLMLLLTSAFLKAAAAKLLPGSQLVWLQCGHQMYSFKGKALPWPWLLDLRGAGR